MWSMLYRLISYVCSWYTVPAGGAPAGPLVVLPVLVVLLLAAWVCVGAAGEKIQDDESPSEPLWALGILAAVLLLPIVMHQLAGWSHQPALTWKLFVILEPFRFFLAGMILAVVLGAQVVQHMSWRWAERQRRAAAGSIGDPPW